MADAETKRYVPWVNHALLPGESTYALLNKLAWFSARGPVQLLRDLRVTDRTPYPSNPSKISYSSGLQDWGVEKPEKIFAFDETLLKQFNGVRHSLLSNYAISTREMKYLRYCPECIAIGMHFTIAQLHLVEECPYHKRRLTSCCPCCGVMIDYECHAMSQAYCCERCGNCLLAADLADISANRRLRSVVSRSYQQLADRLDSTPVIHCPSIGAFRSGSYPGLNETLGPLLHRGRAILTDVFPHYALIEMFRNERGQPAIRKLTEIVRKKEKGMPAPVSDAGVESVAQMRVGSWALRTYNEHLACICAARETLERRSASVRLSICCVGRGFAVWESGRRARAIKEPQRELWDAWKIDDVRDKAFVAYVLEKILLNSIIAAFLREESAARATFESGLRWDEFSTWETTSIDGEEHAVLWQSIQHLDLSDACDLPRYTEAERRRWLELALADLLRTPGIESSGHTISIAAIQSLVTEYGASNRSRSSIETLQKTINACGSAYFL